MGKLFKRYQKVKNEMEENQNVVSVSLDDCVLHISNYGDETTGSTNSIDGIIKRNRSKMPDTEDVESMLSDVEYDEVIGIEENTQAEPGQYLAYVSLVNFSS
jgi:isopentenyl phosphate kinase